MYHHFSNNNHSRTIQDTGPIKPASESCSKTACNKTKFKNIMTLVDWLIGQLNIDLTISGKPLVVKT